LIVVGVAVLLAGVASLGVFFAIQRITVTTKYVRPVVVVVKKTAADTVLAPTDVKILERPVEGVPAAGGFASPDDVIGRKLVKELKADDPVTESDLAPKETGGWLALKIKPGMRAMSVRVNEVINVAGFVVPGTFVDVVVTERPGEDSAARIVLTNVQVLAAGTKTESDMKDEREKAIAKDPAKKKDYQDKPIVSTVVTLLVTPADAERLALAQAEGNIMLTLRNPGDSTPVEAQGTRWSTLMGARNQKAVEAIRGTVLTKEIIK
jgi:pilus assembly protein CpaB